MTKFEGSFDYNPLAADENVSDYSPLEVTGGDDDDDADVAGFGDDDNDGRECDDDDDDDDVDEACEGFGAADAGIAYHRLKQSPKMARAYAKLKVKFFNSVRKHGIPDATVRLLNFYRAIDRKWGIPVRASLAMTFHGKVVHFLPATSTTPSPHTTTATLRMLNEIIAMSYHLANRV